MVLCRKRTKEKSRLFIRNFYTDCPLYYRNCMGAFFASIPAIRQGEPELLKVYPQEVLFQRYILLYRLLHVRLF